MGKTLIGVVTSDKANKTIVVTVQTAKTHPVYKKQYTVSRKFIAHDENNEAEVGYRVAITESRPLSRRKRFVLDKVLQKPAVRELETLADEPVEEQKTEKSDDIKGEEPKS